MNITLTAGERTLKTWDYAKTKEGRKTTQHTLILTDKRIIAASEGPQQIRRCEIPIAAAKSISGSAEKQATFFTYVKLIMSIPFALLIIGIPFLLRTIKELRACAFELTVTTYGDEGAPLTLYGKTEQVQRRGIFALFGKKKQKIYVDKHVAFSIIDELTDAVAGAQRD